MDFKIIIKSGKKVQPTNWKLIDKHIIEYSYSIKGHPSREKTGKAEESARRDGSKIHSFLLGLNKAYNKKDKFKTIILLTPDMNGAWAVGGIKEPGRVFLAVLEGVSLANYTFHRHKTKPETDTFIIKHRYNSKIMVGVMGTYIARDLVNEPLSHLNAEIFSKTLKKLGKESGFNVDVLNEKKIRDLKMGGVLSVNKGSVAKPTFNILTYKSTKLKSQCPVVLVGKGVMYDTGGLSLKPTPNSMDMMKCDMGGAATVVGAIYALAKSRAECYVIGLIPAVENRPGGEAYVPGDVITMMSGKTVEVLNTDAEGRLILADALHYAKRYNPELVIDVATLTGAAARSIGKYGAVGMENYTKEVFGDFSDYMRTLIEAGNSVGERVVVQPFWDDYKQELESSVADIKNLGGAHAGAITAGNFLAHFTDYPWIHLDIAGASYTQAKYGYRGKGATGMGVRLLYQFIKNRA